MGGPHLEGMPRHSLVWTKNLPFCFDFLPLPFFLGKHGTNIKVHTMTEATVKEATWDKQGILCQWLIVWLILSLKVSKQITAGWIDPVSRRWLLHRGESGSERIR